jgi:hypothetical protein
MTKRALTGIDRRGRVSCKRRTNLCQSLTWPAMMKIALTRRLQRETRRNRLISRTACNDHEKHFDSCSGGGRRKVKESRGWTERGGDSSVQHHHGTNKGKPPPPLVVVVVVFTILDQQQRGLRRPVVLLFFGSAFLLEFCEAEIR